MEKEDRIQLGSKSSGSGFVAGSSNSKSLPKKPEKKKVPQRGLGVAQLEKMRLEKEQNKDVAEVASASFLSSPSLPIPNIPHSNQFSSSISFPSVSQADLSSSSLITRLPFPAQSGDVRNSGRLPLVNQAPAVWPRITVHERREDGPRMWNSCEYAKRGNDRADPGLPFQPNVFLPRQSSFSRPPIQFTQEYQQSSSRSVNSASKTLSSSMPNFPMEPPSNQNYRHHYHTTPYLEEEKIGSMKRPYPFSGDNPSGLPSNYQSLTSIPDASAFNKDGGSCRSLNFSTSDVSLTALTSSPNSRDRPSLTGFTSSPNSRDRPSYSTSTLPQNSKKCCTERSVSGDFLALATPSPNPKTSDEALKLDSERSSLPVYNFFGPADDTQDGGAASKDDGESEDSIDLDLKL